MARKPADDPNRGARRRDLPRDAKLEIDRGKAGKAPGLAQDASAPETGPIPADVETPNANRMLACLAAALALPRPKGGGP